MFVVGISLGSATCSFGSSSSTSIAGRSGCAGAPSSKALIDRCPLYQDSNAAEDDERDHWMANRPGLCQFVFHAHALGKTAAAHPQQQAPEEAAGAPAPLHKGPNAAEGDELDDIDQVRA